MFNFFRKNRKQEFSITVDNSSDLINKLDIFEYFYCNFNSKYYSPPISFSALSKAFNSTSYHASSIYVKRNILLSTFKDNALLSAQDFDSLALDYLIFGNAYLQIHKNKLGKIIKLSHLLAKHMRIGKNDDYYYIRENKEELFKDIVHIKSPDFNQQIYGMPEYLAGMQSAFLNEAATLFRRKYYINGAHTGYILHVKADLSEADKKNLQTQMMNAKGDGNFKNLVIHDPVGKDGAFEVIELSQITAKDEFFNMKTLTRDDILAAHRVPPQLMSIVPTNTSGFGNIVDASKVFVKNELEPLQNRFKNINSIINMQAVEFSPYEI